MVNMTPAPLLPRRNPARNAKIETPRTLAGLSTEQLHRWEHATLLYHQFDWQAAADMFRNLSTDIPIDHELERALCCLNAAIIFARLNDFSMAWSILHQTEQVDELLALTLFVMGNVKYALGEFDESESCFQVALSDLGDSTKRFGHLGLDFELDPALIQHNLDALKSVQSKSGNYSSVVALPADGVFESPARSPASGIKTPASDASSSLSTIQSRASTELGLTALPTLGSVSSNSSKSASLKSPAPSVAATKSKRDRPPAIIQQSPDELIARRTLSEDSIVDQPTGELRPKHSRKWSFIRRTSDKKEEAKLRKPRPVNAVRRAEVVVSSFDTSRARVPAHVERPSMEPRDARIHDNATAELAELLKKGPRAAVAEKRTSSVYSHDEGVEEEDSNKHDSMASDESDCEKRPLQPTSQHPDPSPRKWQEFTALPSIATSRVLPTATHQNPANRPLLAKYGLTVPAVGMEAASQLKEPTTTAQRPSGLARTASRKGFFQLPRSLRA